MTWMSINHIVCFDPSRYDISPKVGVLTWFIHPEMGIYSQYSMKYPQKELQNCVVKTEVPWRFWCFWRCGGTPNQALLVVVFFMGKPMILWHPNIDGWWWLQLFGGYGTTRIWHTHLLQWNTSTQTTWKCKIFVDTLYGFDHVEPLDIIWNVCVDPQALWLTRQIVPTCNWGSSVWSPMVSARNSLVKILVVGSDSLATAAWTIWLYLVLSEDRYVALSSCSRLKQN